MIKIYSAKISDFTQADYAKMYSLLECDIREKIDAKKSSDDRQRSLAGYILLYRGAQELYGRNQVKILFNKNGKPLCDFCFFSISHSGEWVICAFSNGEIGVDIQEIREIIPRKEYKLFSLKESFYVNQSADELSLRYLEIFTKKEAAVKMLGLSLGDAVFIDTFSQEFSFKTEFTDRFVVAVCEKK